VKQIQEHLIVQLNQTIQSGICEVITEAIPKHGAEQYGYRQTHQQHTIQHQTKQNVDIQTNQTTIQKTTEQHSYQIQQHELVHGYQTMQQLQHLVIIQEHGQHHGTMQKQYNIQKMEHCADLLVMYDITMQTEQIHVMKEH
jgi:Ulp1 family protease